MEIIADDPEKTTMLDFFEGKPVRFYRMKATGEIGINSEDMAQVMGFQDFQELMSQDDALDIINEWKAENPGQTFINEINPNQSIPMEITTNNTENQATKKPNPANTLSQVLWAISHMIENGQITRSAPALCNVLEEIEGYDSDDMCTLRQVILGHMVEHSTTACVPLGLMEPVALWEEPVYYGMDGSPMDDTPPFGDDYQKSLFNHADKVFGPPASTEEEIHEVYLFESQKQVVFKALDAWIASKGNDMTEEEGNTLAKVLEALA